MSRTENRDTKTRLTTCIERFICREKIFPTKWCRKSTCTTYQFFVWAYERSAMNYTRICSSLGNPDPFRLRYRPLLTEVISSIIREVMGHEETSLYIKRWATQHVPVEDRPSFIDMVNYELKQLHVGNIARYCLPALKPASHYLKK